MENKHNKRSKNFNKRPNRSQKFTHEENHTARIKSHCEHIAAECRQVWYTLPSWSVAIVIREAMVVGSLPRHWVGHAWVTSFRWRICSDGRPRYLMRINRQRWFGLKSDECFCGNLWPGWHKPIIFTAALQWAWLLSVQQLCTLHKKQRFHRQQGRN